MAEVFQFLSHARRYSNVADYTAAKSLLLDELEKRGSKPELLLELLGIEVLEGKETYNWNDLGCEEFEDIEHSKQPESFWASTGWYALAQGRIARKENTRGVEFLLRALEMWPTSHLPHTPLRYVSKEGCDLDDAIARLERIAVRSPDNIFLALSLVDLCVEAGRINESIHWVKVARSIHFRSSGVADDLGTKTEARRSGPDALILGVMKAGTTSLFRYLEMHPQVVTPPRKEIVYFPRAHLLTKEWYESHFPQLPKESEMITLEAQPGYYTYRIQEQIRQDYPDVRLIMIFRNPMKRAISHYYHAKTFLGETRPLSVCLRGDIERFNFVRQLPREEAAEQLFDQMYSDNRLNHYLGMGLYELYLERWLQFFPREQMLLLSFDSLVTKPQQTMNRVYDFLNLPRTSSEQFSVHNAGIHHPQSSTEDLSYLEEFYRPTCETLEKEFNVVLGYH